jgi:hypothetical protein
MKEDFMKARETLPKTDQELKRNLDAIFAILKSATRLSGTRSLARLTAETPTVTVEAAGMALEARSPGG